MKKPTRIWLIDDDPMNNVYNSYLLEDNFKDIQVDSFIFAGDALKELQKFPRLKRVPDLIFLDISMPIINGWEFLDACAERCLWMRYRCKVFMLTASENPNDPRMAVEHPLVNGFVNKPMQLPFLKDLLIQHVGSEVFSAST
jgi:CheY-like chemotaxis protein